MVAEEPFVGGGSHGDGADLRDEGRIIALRGFTELEKPVERMIGVGDESIQAGGGVVLGFHPEEDAALRRLSRHWEVRRGWGPWTGNGARRCRVPVGLPGAHEEGSISSE